MKSLRLAAIAAAALIAIAFHPAAQAATPTCVQGAAGVPPTATLSFTAPTTNTDGSAIATPLTYNVFVGTATGAEKLAASGLAGSPIVVNTGLTANSTAYIYVEVVDAHGVSSLPSNEVCKAFPASTPGTVTITLQ